MPPVLCLLSSPLLGPSVWQPVASGLRERGWQTRVVSADKPASAEDALSAFLAQVPSDRSVALLPHSNAGLYVAPLTAARPVVGTVFVDALLPAREGRTDVASPPVIDFLARRADDEGLLPPWTEWWPEEDVAALFPSTDVRARIEREQRRVPLAYFKDSVAAPSGWDDVPCAYLAFGDTYVAETQEASRRGWQVHMLDGDHLHMLAEPEAVTARIDVLLTSMRLDEQPQGRPTS